MSSDPNLTGGPLGWAARARRGVRRWLDREVPGWRRRRRRSNADSEPAVADPAHALDQLDRWLDRKLPQPRGPLASLAVFVVQLAVGRGSWVAGIFLVGIAAPWFVYSYRQIEAMTLAAYYRVAATGRAEARIEGTGVRLLPDQGDGGGTRAEPYVLLAFESPPGGRTVRVRYLPHGKGFEPFFQWSLGPSLFATPPAYPGDFRFRWIDPQTGQPGFEVRVAETDLPVLQIKAPWNDRTYFENALIDLDRPLDLLLGEWVLRAELPLTAPIRFPPGKPERVFVGDVLRRLPPSGDNGFGELFFSVILLGVFGVPFWWAGTRLIGRPLPRRKRHFMVWVPLALLPLWGTRYLEALERLAPGAGEFNLIARKIGTTQVLPGAEPVEPSGVPPGMRRQRVELSTSRFAPVLARVDLGRPAAPLPDANAVWRELVTRFTAATAALPDAELEAVLMNAFPDLYTDGEPALAPVLLETATRASLDPARPAELRETAVRFLLAILEEDWPPLCSVAFEAKRATLEPLGGHPNLEVAAAAAKFFTEERGWIETRKRDWGAVCP